MTIPPQSLFEHVERISRERSLTFLLVGGNAINAHGYLRTTYDVDLAVPDDQAAAWRAELEALGYEMYFGTDAFQRFKSGNPQPLFPVDLMFLTPETCDKLLQAASLEPVGSVSLPVPHPLHLIAMKLHALRQPARAADGKDLQDIVGLIRQKQIDVRSEQFQDILSRYAKSETKDELFRRLGESF